MYERSCFYKAEVFGHVVYLLVVRGRRSWLADGDEAQFDCILLAFNALQLK